MKANNQNEVAYGRKVLEYEKTFNTLRADEYSKAYEALSDDYSIPTHEEGSLRRLSMLERIKMLVEQTATEHSDR